MHCPFPQAAREETGVPSYLSDNRLADWHANLMRIGPHRWVLKTNERSLLRVAVPIKDSAQLRKRSREHAHAPLYHPGVPPDVGAAEVRGMRRMPFAQPPIGCARLDDRLPYPSRGLCTVGGRPRDLTKLEFWVAKSCSNLITLTHPSSLVERLGGSAAEEGDAMPANDITPL